MKKQAGKLKQTFEKWRSPDVRTPSRASVAYVVQPFLDVYPEIATPRQTAKAFDELSEWLRIGFDKEKNKGGDYETLQRALRSLAAGILASPAERDDVYVLKTEDLQAFKSSFHQLIYAAVLLQSSHQENQKPPRQVQDRHGNTLNVPRTQIYNRPYASHAEAAEKLLRAKEAADRFFTVEKVRAAGYGQGRSILGFRRFLP